MLDMAGNGDGGGDGDFRERGDAGECVGVGEQEGEEGCGSSGEKGFGSFVDETFFLCSAVIDRIFRAIRPLPPPYLLVFSAFSISAATVACTIGFRFARRTTLISAHPFLPLA